MWLWRQSKRWQLSDVCATQSSLWLICIRLTEITDTKWNCLLDKELFNYLSRIETVVLYFFHSKNMPLVRRCRQLNPPLFGHFIGPCDDSHGSTCQVGCQNGYILHGSDDTKCSRNASTGVMSWDRVGTCRSKLTTDSWHWESNVSPILCDLDTDSIGSPCTMTRTRTQHSYSRFFACTPEANWPVQY